MIYPCPTVFPFPTPISRSVLVRSNSGGLEAEPPYLHVKIVDKKLHVKILDEKIFVSYSWGVERDLVDEFIDQWRQERPDVDASSLGVISRVLMLYKHIEHAADNVLAPLGLTLWQLDLLAALRRSGRPFTLSPTQLMRALTLSSGAMTNRLDRLEERGLVRRMPDPYDRRGVLVALTDDGRRLTDKAVTIRLELQKRLLESIDESEQQTMTRLLRKLLLTASNGLAAARPDDVAEVKPRKSRSRPRIRSSIT